MPYTLDRQNKADAPSFRKLYVPVYGAMLDMPRWNREETGL